jgi:hypothetical protein
MSRLKGKETKTSQDEKTYIEKRTFKGWYEVARENICKSSFAQITAMKEKLDFEKAAK